MTTNIRIDGKHSAHSASTQLPTSQGRWLSGIIPPMITPLLANGSLDVAGLERLIEHLIVGGVQGIFLLGSTGEGPSLSFAMRRELVELTTRQVAGRIPVLVGVTDTSYSESLELARFASEAGGRAVVASAPYYYRLSQAELLEYVERIAASVPLPLVLYNIPQLTKTWFEVETVRRAFELENVIGLKDSSGNLAYFRRLQELAASREDISLLIGQEELLMDSIFTGGHGGVCGGANIFPQLYTDLYRLCLDGDAELALVAHNDIMEIGRALYSIAEGDGAVIKAVKCALSVLGICQDNVAPALHSLDRDQTELLSSRFAVLSSLCSPGIRSVYALNQVV